MTTHQTTHDRHDGSADEETADRKRLRGRAITREPGYHWFGYYDKLQFSRDGRYVLGMRVDFEHRSPKPDDPIRIGMVDLRDEDRWIDLGETTAWCWQQGCMLQWLPGSDEEVIYNIRTSGTGGASDKRTGTTAGGSITDGFGAEILNIRTGRTRRISRPIYALSPDGRAAVGIDHARTGWLRPGYGYAGVDPTADADAPEDGGIYRIDLESGESRLVISLAQIVSDPWHRQDINGMCHWFNHLLFSPDGSRFIFLHRCRPRDKKGMYTTRMFTADPEGREISLVDDYGGMSHFIWRDNETILAWAERPRAGAAFYLFDGRSGEAEPIGIGKMTRNGHCTYLIGGNRILNDTYPAGPHDRGQELYVYYPETDTRREIARLESPPAYTGEWRCDLHPRSSPDGTMVCVDSPHAGGRQMYLYELDSDW